MEQLIIDYLISIHHYLAQDGEGRVRLPEIQNIEPFIKYDEQCYKVTVVNECCAFGTEDIEVNISALLTFMYAVKK
jgi:hypothetical protein